MAQTTVITFYGRSHLSEKALLMFKEIPSFRCYRSIKSVNTLLNALLNCKEYIKIGEMLKNFEKYGTPDVCTFNILMKMCCNRGDLRNARQVFDEMCKRGITPNVVTFGTLINGLCANGELNEAFRMKRVMERDFKLKGTNAFVYVALIKGLCKVDDLLGYIDEMEGKGCKPDVISCNVIIRGLCDDGKLREASELLDDMPRRRCKPDVVSYRIYLDGLCKAMKFKEAAVILHEMVFKGYENFAFI
ncbi:putative pentatricopeptide repeat-containing protein At1g53330 [Lycium ferocissimum]|uniref:putative pentatricopeptide repeat-containing protein At1g53330 n=1 Tax=Lycium ferocissimum TaxID=112874 RepID=UPI002815A16C|nr:putative pentatricopeptide repeat-containing protein At1g53330 [Lycium ferocissimum]